MPTYSVTLSVTGSYSTEIDADSEDDAIEQAEQKFQADKKSLTIDWLDAIETELENIEDIFESEEEEEEEEESEDSE